MRNIFLFILCIGISIKSLAGNVNFSQLESLKSLANGTVFSIVQDSIGAIWLNTSYGLYRYNGISLNKMMSSMPMKPLTNNSNNIFALYNNSILKFNIKDHRCEQIRDNRIEYNKSFLLAENDTLWIASDNRLLYYHNNIIHSAIVFPPNQTILALVKDSRKNCILLSISKKGLFSFSKSNQKLSHLIRYSGKATSIYIDHFDNTWFGTEDDGAYKYTINYSSYKHYDISSGLQNNYIHCFCSDASGNVWIGTMTGISVISNNQNNQIVYSDIDKSYSVRSLYPDNQGGIWIGTFYDGVFYSNIPDGLFTKIKFPESQKVRLINAIVEDKRQNIWIFTDTYGMYKIDLHSKTRTQLIPNTNHLKFKTAYYDSIADIIWIGTYRDGLKKYDISSNKWIDYTFRGKNGIVKKEVVNDIIKWRGDWYLGTYHGIAVFYPNSDSINFKYIPGYNDLVFSLCVADTNHLLIGGQNTAIYDIREKKSMPYLRQSENTKSIPFFNLYKDSKNLMWGTSIGNGFFCIGKNDITNFNRDNIGLNDNYTSFIGEIKPDLILVGTNSGISIFDKKRMICYNYNNANGCHIASTRSGSMCRRKNGEILIGGTDGLISLNVNNLNLSHDSIDFIFDNLQINHQTIVPGDSTNILSQCLPYTKEIELKYYENNLIIGMASFDFAKAYPIFYEYRLAGMDTKWIPFDINSPIVLSNLTPGRYILHVRASLNKFSSQYIVKQLAIHIHAPWYATTISKIIYCILFIGFIVFLFFIIHTRLLTKQKMLQSEKEAKDKTQFFLNMSHELRTPLTIIIGQLELFVHNNSNNEGIADAYKQACKMQNMITDLLDYEKQNQGYSSLSVSRENMNDIIHEIYDDFYQYALYRNINLVVTVPPSNIETYVDKKKIKQVLSNLLMNAFKYTPNNGTISLIADMQDTDNHLMITISDNGIGMDEDTANKIFNPFYQDNNATSYASLNYGTGIGLALCKGIIELHHGTISVSGEIKKGSSFQIILPTNDDWFVNDKRIVRQIKKDDNIKIDVSLQKSDEPLMQSQSINSLATLLIVEDEDDLRGMLVAIFKSTYIVYDATNGQEAIDIVHKKKVDIIITDISMPIMDGMELCKKIKDDFYTCHIPVIMLTALGGIPLKIESLNIGVDDYVEKPFNIDLLKSKCQNILENRRKLQHKFSVDLSNEATLPTINNSDQKLMKKITDLIEAHIFSSDLNVSFLCSELAIGKTLLTNKIKAISSYSPREFIEVIRLKKAASLLLETDLNISQIAYDLGFNTPKYFTIRFKRHFGVSPSEFIKNNSAESTVEDICSSQDNE